MRKTSWQMMEGLFMFERRRIVEVEVELELLLYRCCSVVE